MLYDHGSVKETDECNNYKTNMVTNAGILDNLCHCYLSYLLQVS